jgi:hypothetical protein
MPSAIRPRRSSRDAEAGELGRAVAGADHEEQPPSAEDVDKRRLLGHLHRVAEGEQQKRQADL